jgi:parvulin-like peptidyl-prolyl isomerase
MEDQAHVLEIMTEDRMEALRIRKELKDGDVRDFKDRARRHSVGVTASTGGDLGFFQRGDLPEDFEEAIFSLKPGQLSEPFESDYGFHVFLIEEWIPRHPQKFFEVRDQIFEMLVSEKERRATTRILDDMLGNATIEFYDPSLDFSLEERRPEENRDESD